MIARTVLPLVSLPFLACLALLSPGAAAQSCEPFLARGPYVPTFADPSSIEAADLDGVNGVDIVTVHRNSGTVSVFLNDGAGGLMAPQLIGAGSNLVGVATGDVDGNGTLELLLADAATDEVIILINNGTGVFSLANRRNLSVAPQAGIADVAVANLDGVGPSEIVVCNSQSSDLMVFRLNGLVFQSSALAVTQGPVALAVADFDGQNGPDVATLSAGTDTVTVCLNDGSGAFSAARRFDVGVLANPVAIAAGNLDGIGGADICTCSTTGSDVSILSNRSTGALSPSSFLPRVDIGLRASQPLRLAVGDLTNDGRDDIVTSNLDSSVSVISRRTGIFALESASPIATRGLETADVVVTDFDRSGRYDIAVINRNSDDLEIFANEACISFDIVGSNLPTGYLIALSSSRRTPGAVLLNAVTFSQGNYPNGWFYGIDITLNELFAQANFGAPFVSTADASGASTEFILLPQFGPLGVQAFGVSVELSAFGGLPTLPVGPISRLL